MSGDSKCVKINKGRGSGCWRGNVFIRVAREGILGKATQELKEVREPALRWSAEEQQVAGRTCARAQSRSAPVMSGKSEGAREVTAEGTSGE